MYIKNGAIMSKSFEQLGLPVKSTSVWLLQASVTTATTISIPFSNPFVLATLFILLETPFRSVFWGAPELRQTTCKNW